MRKLAGVLALLLFASCTKVYLDDDRGGSVAGPATVLRGRVDEIEFRVIGNLGATAVAIRHTDTIDGLTFLSGPLPYIASIQSDRSSIFLFLEASATPAFLQSPPAALQVQIFVNGRLFKEAFSQNPSSLFAQASGTFRR